MRRAELLQTSALKLEFYGVLASGVQAGNLGPAAMTWGTQLLRQCCYGFHMQTSNRGVGVNFVLIFNAKVYESSFERPSVYQK